MVWIIGIGGALGAAARFIVGNRLNKRTFPVGTWLVNIVGSFVLGFITQLYLANQIGDALFYFGGVGFCGAFTTFSTFGFETVTLIRLNKMKLAIIYVISSIIVGVISAMIGLYI